MGGRGKLGGRRGGEVKGVPSVFVEVALFFVFVVVAGRRLDLAVVHLEGREVFPGLGELSWRRGGPGSIAAAHAAGRGTGRRERRTRRGRRRGRGRREGRREAPAIGGRGAGRHKKSTKNGNNKIKHEIRGIVKIEK